MGDLGVWKVCINHLMDFSEVLTRKIIKPEVHGNEGLIIFLVRIDEKSIK